MNILICGAKGFIGRHMAEALRAQGHTVIEGISPRAASNAAAQAASAPPDSISGQRSMVIDYTQDHHSTLWQQRLQDFAVDAVVNTIGVLRHTSAKPIHAIHTQAPIALFNGAVAAGVKHVVQISANGIEGSPTQYAQTKLAADQALWQHIHAGRIQGAVLRPSVVFGQGGASSSMFVNLSKLPVVVLPAIMQRTRVQPVAVQDLARCVANLITAKASLGTPLHVVGPVPLSFEALIATLRAQAGKSAAKTIAMSDWMSQLSARMGDFVAQSPWFGEALDLLQHDNTADNADFNRWLGQAPIAPDQFMSHWGRQNA